jgi:hypothetical protein
LVGAVGLAEGPELERVPLLDKSWKYGVVVEGVASVAAAVAAV